VKGQRIALQGAVLLTSAMLAVACSASSDNSATVSSTSSSARSAHTNTASARGVRADTIKIGFTYVDLASLAAAGVIKTDHGDYAAMMKSIVDDVNAHGGINGRKLELFLAKYSPVTNTEQIAACTTLTEDDKVFAVLNGLQGDSNLCITQQHSTILVGGVINSIQLAKAKAPWATATASDDRAIAALVQALDAAGSLKGKTIGLYGITLYQPLVDIAHKALTDRGYKVTATAINDAPAGDTQALRAQDKVIAQRFMDQHVDTVIDVSQSIPGTSFDAVGYHPALYLDSLGGISAAKFTNPLAKFPIVAGLAENADQDAPYTVPSMQHCVEVYKQATGRQIVNQTQENELGKSTGFVGMEEACTSLQIFVAAAKAAGADLTNETWAKGLASLGTVELPVANPGSFGPNKPDAQDRFQLMKFNPEFKSGTTIPQFIAIGDPITSQT
jgi:hypothetical protein